MRLHYIDAEWHPATN